MTKAQKKIYKALTKIPKGKVTTYGILSEVTGIRSAQAVGNILHINPDHTKYPCHRVVNRLGKLAQNFGHKEGISMQKKRLEDEGVQVTEYQVDLQKYLWTFK